MAKVDTLPDLYRPLMDGVSIKAPYCCVCGKRWPLNYHHVVKRSAGNIYRNGVAMPKPVLPLCGQGNTSGCHGLAHHEMLHFRWVTENDRRFCDYTVMDSWVHGFASKGGHWEYLSTEEPTKYQAALEMEGWKPLPSFGYNECC